MYEEEKDYIVLNVKSAAELERRINEEAKFNYVPFGNIFRGGEGLLLIMKYEPVIEISHK